VGRRPPGRLPAHFFPRRRSPLWDLWTAGLRLPLAPLSAQYHDTVRAALRESGVL